MAVIRLGSIVTDIVGRVGGQNFQRSAFGNILRNISTKRNFQKVVQLAPLTTNVKGKFAYVTQFYKTLTPTQISIYQAACPSFPRINKYGVTYTPSAFQLFCEMNLVLNLLGLDIQTSPPTVSTFVSAVYTVVYNSAAPSLVITQSTPFTASPYRTVVTACTYQSNGLAVQAGRMKILVVNQFNIANPTLNILSLIISTFGPVHTGTTIYVGVKQVNVTTGELNKPQYFQVQF